MIGFGTIATWNAARGFGFVRQDDTRGPDVFVHASHLRNSGFAVDNLPPGTRVRIEYAKTLKGYEAVTVWLLDELQPTDDFATDGA